jgi:flagellar hook-associated protein 1 FlgK
MSVSSILDLALTGLNAQSLAMQVTGENITNVNTAGYSRQTANLETAPVSLFHGFPLGNGVKVSTIYRTYDSFLQSQMMTANSTSGQAKSTNSALQSVQPLFNDLTSDGLGTSLQNFFKSWQDLTANPQGVPERQSVLSNGQQLVDDFHRINTNLVGVKGNMNQSLEQITTDVNDQLQQIANLNTNIKQVEISNGNANEMRDQRELLMRQLSEKMGVTYTDQADGTVNVNLTSGQSLVTSNNAAVLSLTPQALPPNYYDVMLTPPGGGPAVVATGFIGGPGNSQGAIGATLQIRDTVVNKYIADLDELAYTVANQLNTVHKAGFGLNGTQTDFFTPVATPGVPPFAPLTVAGYSQSIALNITNPDDIAAADADPTVGGTGNNKNAQTIASLYDKTLSMSGGTMTLAGFYNALVGKVGVAVQAAGRSETQSGAMVTQLGTQRESLCGVSLDEELVNLTKYQKAYQGAAKMVNVGTEMLDTVLGMIR